jgi:hypothetical protein
MDKELEDLENELLALVPKRPSAALAGRIEAELSPRKRIAWAWGALPLAATVAVLLSLYSRPAAENPSRAHPPSAPFAEVAVAPVFKPVVTQNLLYDAQDDGIVTLADGSKARQVSRSYVDTVVWRDPQSRASLTWSVPRNEVRVTPISFQ